MLPEGWRKLALCDVAEIRTGIAKNERISGEYIDIPYLRVANVQDGNIDIKEIKSIKIEKNKISRYLLQYGDVLMTEGGDFDKLGRGDVWKEQISPCVHQNHVFAVRPNRNKLNSEFLSALASSNYGRLYFLSCAKRSTNLASINATQLKKFPVILPPLLEQNAIIAVLSIWDKAISTTDTLLANSRQQKKALMQQLLTGKRRLPGFTGEWYHACLGKIAHIEKGKPLNGSCIIKGEIPVIAGGKTVSAWHNDFTHNTVITVSASGAYAGFVSFHKYKIWASDCSVINGICNISLSQYLYYLLLFKQKEIYSLQTGGAQPHVYPKDLAKLTCSLPPLDEQSAIAAVLDAADREIVLLEQKAARLREEKKALMQQLLTGKRRVRL